MKSGKMGKPARKGWLLLAALVGAEAPAWSQGAAPAAAPVASHLGTPPVGRSGLASMSRELQAMQADDSLNPGMLWVQAGRALWQQAPAGGRSCAGCHGREPGTTLAGVAARYPAWDATSGRPVTLARRIDQCRVRHQQAPAWGPQAAQVLELQAALAHASRGHVVTPAADPGLAAWRDQGARLWHTRLGQLDLACADCHDRHAGKRLGGQLIPPANGVGYPSYRLEWQTLGPLQRRLRNCLTGVRAEPWPPEAPEWVALELFLAWRDRGLPIEAPAVRP